MELKPHNYQRMLLTFIGLALLILVLVLNHLHPRDQGVADITHGSIHKLTQGISFAVQADSFSGGSVYSLSPGQFSNRTQNEQQVKASTQAPTSASVNLTGALARSEPCSGSEPDVTKGARTSSQKRNDNTISTHSHILGSC